MVFRKDSALNNIPEYLVDEKLEQDIIYNEDGSLNENIELLNVNAVNLPACLIDEIHDGLESFNTWENLHNYIKEFKIEKLFDDERFYSVNHPELMKGFFKFKGTWIDLQYIMKVVGFELAIYEAQDFYDIDGNFLTNEDDENLPDNVNEDDLDCNLFSVLSLDLDVEDFQGFRSKDVATQIRKLIISRISLCVQLKALQLNLKTVTNYNTLEKMNDPSIIDLDRTFVSDYAQLVKYTKSIYNCTPPPRSERNLVSGQRDCKPLLLTDRRYVNNRTPYIIDNLNLLTVQAQFERVLLPHDERTLVKSQKVVGVYKTQDQLDGKCNRFIPVEDASTFDIQRTVCDTINPLKEPNYEIKVDNLAVRSVSNYPISNTGYYITENGSKVFHPNCCKEVIQGCLPSRPPTPYFVMNTHLEGKVNNIDIVKINNVTPDKVIDFLFTELVNNVTPYKVAGVFFSPDYTSPVTESTVFSLAVSYSNPYKANNLNPIKLKGLPFGNIINDMDLSTEMQVEQVDTYKEEITDYFQYDTSKLYEDNYSLPSSSLYTEATKEYTTHTGMNAIAPILLIPNLKVDNQVPYKVINAWVQSVNNLTPVLLNNAKRDFKVVNYKSSDRDRRDHFTMSVEKSLTSSVALNYVEAMPIHKVSDSKVNNLLKSPVNNNILDAIDKEALAIATERHLISEVTPYIDSSEFEITKDFLSEVRLNRASNDILSIGQESNYTPYDNLKIGGNNVLDVKQQSIGKAIIINDGTVDYSSIF